MDPAACLSFLDYFYSGFFPDYRNHYDEYKTISHNDTTFATTFTAFN